MANEIGTNGRAAFSGRFLHPFDVETCSCKCVMDGGQQSIDVATIFEALGIFI